MRKMTGSFAERTSLSASTMSGAPSLANSLHSCASSNSSKLSLNSKSKHSNATEDGNVVTNLLEKAKFYTSLCLGTSAILSVFAFLFLIPFVVDPAISTIVADYNHIPVTCIVTDHTYGEGLRNCTWSSCREGCTTAATRCHQLMVNYSRIPWHEFQSHPHELDSMSWDVADTKLLINSEGCGYPPHVNCSEFAKKYGFSHVGEPFPCFYSRAYPDVHVITRYSWEDNLKHLILSLIVPNVIFAISIGVLSYWYCPCCDKACRRTTRVYAEKYPDKEDSIEAWDCDTIEQHPTAPDIDKRNSDESNSNRG